jgi:hypothetical protein
MGTERTRVLEYKAANHPSWSAFPQIPELCEVGRYPIPFCKCGALKGEEKTFVGNDVVLIVDDSKFIAQAYSRGLLGLGYRVLIACDGKTGLFCC